MGNQDIATLKELSGRLDNSNMAAVIERFPDQFDTALSQALPRISGGPFKEAIIAGMGGSALPAEIVLDAFSDHIRHPIRVVRNYRLPYSIDENTLLIISSFSGNTEETLSVIEHYAPDAPNVVVVSTGGRLEALARERHYSLVRIPTKNEPVGFQPRSATGYFVTFFTRLLMIANIIEDCISELAAVPSFLRGLHIREDAFEIARWLGPRIPVIYTEDAHQTSIARVAKIKFNENSKRPAFFNSFPEANHNEMIGFLKRLGEFGILYLHDPTSDPRLLERYNVMRNVFQKEQIDNVYFKRWDIPGATTIERVFAALALIDMCSYILALLDGYDPSPVELVEKFKHELESSRPNTSLYLKTDL
jgi:glucose/mannose-6-phosphate isomerase